MAISFYEASVTGYLQILDAVGGFLAKGLTHCRETGIDPESVVEASVIADMRPFRFQIISVVHHSLGAIEGMREGRFRPPGDKTPYDYAGLQALIGRTAETLRGLKPAAIEALEGNEIVFEVGDMRLHFTAGGFLMSFSLPNFHFHATTAYDILRAKGVPLGKRDYVGAPRLKG